MQEKQYSQGGDNMNFSFDGVKKDYIEIDESESRPVFAPIQRNILMITGLPGGYLQDTETKPRSLSVPVNIKFDSFEDLQKLKEDLASWLITSETKELIFDDEPDRTYFAAVDESFNFDEIVNSGKGAITFTCPDPYKYGPEQTEESTTDAVAISVEGSVETYPVITCEIGSDTTFVAVSNGDKLNLIGNPTLQEEEPYEAETQLYKTTCNTLTGWTAPSTVEYGTLLGTLKTNGSDFYSDAYGSDATNWHGPAMKTSIGQTVQDFKFDFGFSAAVTGNNQAGLLKVSLLNASNQFVARLQVAKQYGNLNKFYITIQVGTATKYNLFYNYNGPLLDGKTLSGILRLRRKGNVWTAQIFISKNGSFQSPISATWTDKDSIATSAITQIQAELMQRATFPVINQKIADLVCYRVNDPGDGQVPIIAKAGDVIEFDHQTDIIRKNGIDITKDKAFIGEYFALQPGVNTILAEPADSIDSVEVRWRPRWR